MSDDKEIVAVALLTREDVKRIGSTLKLIYRADDLSGFDDLIEALDRAGSAEGSVDASV